VARSKGFAVRSWASVAALSSAIAVVGGVFVNVAPATTAESATADDVGVVDPASAQWHLRSSDGGVTSFYFGDPGDVPFMGDWDCDGDDTPGLYRRGDGFVYLRNDHWQGTAHRRFYLGNPGDLPLAGDFDGDGCDTVSVYRPAESRIFIINRLGADGRGVGVADVSYVFGDPGDRPFVGDFDGDGIDTIGMQRVATGYVYLRQSHTQGVADAAFYFGDPGDLAIAGDWTARGSDSPALFRPPDATFYFRDTNSQGIADRAFPLGDPGWVPVAGSAFAGGRVVIEATSDPPGAKGFIFSGGLGAFALNDDGQAEFEVVGPRTYVVTERDPRAHPGGYRLAHVRCTETDTTGRTTVSVASHTATIRVDGGDTVTCRFEHQRGPAVPSRPNVILVLGDDLGWGDYGFMGHPVASTPNIDRLASESLTFRNGFVSASLCTPSHMSLLTGMNWLQWDSRVGGMALGPGEQAVAHMEPLPSLLTDAGYDSFQAGKYWFGGSGTAGFTAGTSADANSAIADDFGRESMAPLFDHLDSVGAQPFYAYVAPELPHVPWDPPQQYLDRYAGRGLTATEQVYYAQVSRLDDRVGELLDYLEANGLRDDTVVIFLADNGYQVDPSGTFNAAVGDRRGKLTMYEMGFRTPILVSWPGTIPEGVMSDKLVTAEDLYVTTLGLAGATVPPGRIGIDLGPYLTVQGSFDRDAVFGAMLILRRGVPGELLPYAQETAYYYRDARWRYIWFADAGRSELYDISRDPLETTDLIAAHPALAARFQIRIEAWLADLPYAEPGPVGRVATPPCLLELADWMDAASTGAVNR
jgi:uncharacterized sulfatase